MSRVRGLSNDRYAERKAAITHTLRELFREEIQRGVTDEERKFIEKLS